MKWFVYYKDGFTTGGDEVGLRSFDTSQEALDFITKERTDVLGCDLSVSDFKDYILIEGVELIIAAKEVITKLKIGGFKED